MYIHFCIMPHIHIFPDIVFYMFFSRNKQQALKCLFSSPNATVWEKKKNGGELPIHPSQAQQIRRLVWKMPGKEKRSTRQVCTGPHGWVFVGRFFSDGYEQLDGKGHIFLEIKSGNLVKFDGIKCQTCARWWFQRFFMFSPTWGRFPFWLIFFNWVETTNQFGN